MSPSTNNNNARLRELLEYVKNTRGFDFTGYKLSTLSRRFQKRMAEVGIADFAEYQDYLEVHPEEFERLFNTLLINVTSFFRDPEAWQVIRQEVIPAILECWSHGEPVRLWSVGCASGEEAYTAAILLAEEMGIEAFRRRVKIYATDVDQEALSEARHATYQASDLEPLTPEQRDRFFDLTDSGYAFRRDLRRQIIFGRHDLVQDAPISKIDLLLCRNTLMYFNAETQQKVLARFRFALHDHGHIFLGKAEMLLAYSDVFVAVNLKHRIFRKLPTLNLQDRMLVMAQSGNQAAAGRLADDHERLREVGFDSGPQARIVVDVMGQVAMVNTKARELFNVTTQDLGRPLQDLEVSYRPVELRSRIDEAREQRRSIFLRDVVWHTPRKDMVILEVEVCPLIDTGNSILGVSINFTDVTPYKQLRQELEHSKQELEVAYEELQSTNEELETTNEELQSSNEELETTNEELQSTNEELETMNEELQSTNEELQTVNDELHDTSAAVNDSNNFLEAILASLQQGVVVINRDLVIQVWNTQAAELWGIRTDEAIGRHLLNLDIGLPLDELRQPIRDCLNEPGDRINEFTLQAVNRRGFHIQCAVTCTALIYPSETDSEAESLGVILLMKDSITSDQSE